MEFDYAKLRTVRQERRLTIQELAEQAQVSASLISQIERGKVVPTLTVFWRICKALDIPMHIFLKPIPPSNMWFVERTGRCCNFPILRCAISY